MKLYFAHLIEKLETSLLETEALKGRPASFRTMVITLIFSVITILTFGIIELVQQ